jgi:hypothetical protein
MMPEEQREVVYEFDPDENDTPATFDENNGEWDDNDEGEWNDEAGE